MYRAGAEDLIGAVHEIYGGQPEYYSDPFFKFNVSIAQGFTKVVDVLAHRFVVSSIRLTPCDLLQENWFMIVLTLGTVFIT